MIVLDTDVLIEIFDKHSKRGDQAIEYLEQSDEDIAITSLTVHEILYGHYKRKKKLVEIQEMNTLDFTKKDAYLSANLEYDAEKKGMIIPRIDCMIAAMIITRNAKLLTFNIKHFQQIKQLKLVGL